jgi:hypothetical protein
MTTAASRIPEISDISLPGSVMKASAVSDIPPDRARAG